MWPLRIMEAGRSKERQAGPISWEKQKHMADGDSSELLLAGLTREIATMQLLSSGSSEPAYRWLADPPGKAVMYHYLQKHPRCETDQGPILPVFYAELPPAPSGRGKPNLTGFLLAQLGDTSAANWKDALDRTYRLADLIHTYQVELVVLAAFHHLCTPTGRFLTDQLEWLVSFFRAHLKTIPLLAIGEKETVNSLILASSSGVMRRFHRIRLPGEPPEPDDPDAWAELRKRLGLDTLN